VIKNIETNMKWKGEDCIIKGRNTSKKSVLEYGIIVESQAAALSPVKIGRLRGSIVTQTKSELHTGKDFGKSFPEDIIKKPTDDTETRDVALVGTDVKYANYVEYGTKHQSAQPYMRPAIDLTQGKSLTVFRNNGRQEFKEYFKGKA